MFLAVFGGLANIYQWGENVKSQQWSFEEKGTNDMTYTINYQNKLYHEVLIIYPFSNFGSSLFEKLFFMLE